MEGDFAETANPGAETVGEKLRVAREAQGLDLPEIASRTRIPQRHLEAIEASNYTGLPSVTYAMGFARAYARAVGADEVAIARQLRQELGDNPERAAPTPAYELSDPRRQAPGGIVWAGLIVAILVLVGAGLYFGTDLFRGGASSSASAVETMPVPTASPTALAEAAATPAQPAPAAGGQVTLVAKDKVWVRVSDAGGKRLFEKEMAKGERYDVPADAQGPHARTGLPDNLDVLVNGSAVAPLGTGVKTVDVPVSAAALQARAPAPAASGAAGQP